MTEVQDVLKALGEVAGGLVIVALVVVLGVAVFSVWVMKTFGQGGR